MEQKQELDFFSKPQNIRKLWIMLYAVCGILILLGLFIHGHAEFKFAGFFGFYAVLGFVSCAVLILFSKLVGFVLKVKEDYYDK